jgi:hypothetical protein
VLHTIEQQRAILESIETFQCHTLNQTMNSYATNYTVERTETRHQGSWDCPVCTLINVPYQDKCQACQTRASSHVLTFQLFPQDLRFGLEIEIVIPFGKRDGLTCESIAMLNAIQRIGIASNTNCGFHVHVVAEKGSMLSSLNAIKAICQSFVSVENALDVLVSDPKKNHGRRTNQNRYCKSNRILFGSMSNKQRWNTIGSALSIKHMVVQMMNPHNDRYRKLNLTNLIKKDRPSTVEFRHHGGVEDLQESEAWIRFVLQFCQNAVRKASDDICLLSEHATVENELEALFTLVGCDGLEQFFTMDRKLFHGNRITNEWMCNVCKKTFLNSRSLSQHCASAVGHGVL